MGLRSGDPSHTHSQGNGCWEQALGAATAGWHCACGRATCSRGPDALPPEQSPDSVTVFTVQLCVSSTHSNMELEMILTCFACLLFNNTLNVVIEREREDIYFIYTCIYTYI